MGYLIPLISGFSGLVGVAAGALLNSWLAGRRDRAIRRAEFLTRQLQEFYGPILSMRLEILARSELRVKVQHAAAQMEGLPVMMAITRDENATLRDQLMPSYQNMVATFREKMWLAEPETRAHFKAFVEYVDVWEKVLRDALPRDIAPAIGHTEENLKPFYANLEAVHDRLRKELAS